MTEHKKKSRSQNIWEFKFDKSNEQETSEDEEDTVWQLLQNDRKYQIRLGVCCTVCCTTALIIIFVCWGMYNSALSSIYANQVTELEATLNASYSINVQNLTTSLAAKYSKEVNKLNVTHLEI